MVAEASCYRIPWLGSWKLRPLSLELSYTRAIHLNGHQFEIGKVSVVVCFFLAPKRETGCRIHSPYAREKLKHTTMKDQ